MKPCNDKIKMTPEEKKLLSESIFKILCDGLDIINRRFYNVNDFSCRDELSKQPNEKK